MFGFINTVILPLALQNRAWFFQLFSTVRGSAIGIATASTKLAMGIAAIIVVLKMIRISYNVMSDEQHAGFGGIKLWEILRPMLILILIQGCTIWVGALDSVANYVSVSVSRSVDALGDRKSVVDMFVKDEKSLDAFSPDDIKATTAEADEEYQKTIESLAQMNTPGASMLLAWYELTNKQGRMEKKALREFLSDKSEDPEKSGKAIRKSVNNYYNAMKHTTKLEDGTYEIDVHDKNLIPMICCWLYDHLYIVVQCVAEIMLMILAMCSPWVLVISLLDPWKQAFITFLTTYIQISFWKVVAAMINYATILTRTATINFCATEALNQMYQAIGGVVPTDSTRAAIGLSAIVSIAGVFCLLKIQDITAAIIPSASNLGSASGGAGTAMSAGKAPANVVGTAAGKTIGGIQTISTLGHNSKKAQQMQADRIGESVAKHLNKQNP